MLKALKKGLILLIIFIVFGVLFFAVNFIMKGGAEGISIGKFNADLRIYSVQVINYEEVDVNIKKTSYQEEIKGVNIILYDKEDNKIGNYQNTIEELRESDFKAVLIVENTSRIKKVSIAPIITSNSGEEYFGGVQDIYKFIYNGTMHSPLKPGTGYSKEPVINCESTSDCRDNDPCTIGSCSNGFCVYPTIIGCEFCTSDNECNDNNSCTNNTCLNQRCSYFIIKECESCNYTTQCQDNNPCTKDECTEKKCFHNQIANCSYCTSNSDCEDNNSCTTDVCYSNTNKCSHLTIPGCTSCNLSSECSNNSICMNSICVISVNTNNTNNVSNNTSNETQQ